LLAGLLRVLVGNCSKIFFRALIRVKIRNRLKLLVNSFQKVVWWILTSKYKAQMGTAYASFPGQDVYSGFKETSRRLAWLLLEYLRMDLIDGQADSLHRLESWLSSELGRIRTTLPKQ
jgi:hypothetical protein